MGNSMTLNMTGCVNYQRNFMKISLTILSRDCDNAWKELERASSDEFSQQNESFTYLLEFHSLMEVRSASISQISRF